MYPPNTVAVPPSYLLDIVDNNNDQPVQLPNPSRLTLLKGPKKKEKGKRKRERKDDDVAWDKKSRWKKKLSAKYGTWSLVLIDTGSCSPHDMT